MTIQTSNDFPIKYISSQHFIGCNQYYQSSVLQQSVDFGVFTATTTATLGNAFPTNFIDRFQNLKSFIPNNGLKDEFISRLKSSQGIEFGELLLEAILAVENSIFFTMRNLHTISYANIDKYEKYTDLIWSCAIPKISRQASAVALKGILELLPKKYFKPSPNEENFSTAYENLQKSVRSRRSSVSTAILKCVAQKQGIPCKTLGRQHLRLGHGEKQQNFYASMTSTTSITAQKICADKRLTLRYLHDLRLPVPQHIRVNNLEAAYAAARKFDFSILIKPLKGKTNIANNVALTSPESIKTAFEQAQKLGNSVLIERFEAGLNYRLLIVGGKFIAASLRKPPVIIGDGQSTLEQLIDRLNADPLRDNFRLYQIRKDDELNRLLAQSKLTMDDVVAKGREVILHSTGNISTGGISIDVTDQVHPDNYNVAKRAANSIGLDVAGIDFVTTDISRSYREIGGAIVKINARPALRIHTWPKQGKARNVAGAVLKLFYTAENNGHIPIIAIAGDKSTGATARMLDMILRGAGQSIALAMRDRAFINGISAELSSIQQRRTPLFLLRDPQINSLVTTVSPRQVTKRGLLFENCQLTVILDKKTEADTDSFHLGLDILKRATTGCFVLNAGNTVALNRLRDIGARQLILVSDRLNDPALQSHLNAGHMGVSTMWREGKTRIVVYSGTELKAAFKTVNRGSRDSRAKTRRIKNGKMFAIAAAFGLGLSGSDLKKAFENAPEMIKDREETD